MFIYNKLYLAGGTGIHRPIKQSKTDGANTGKRDVGFEYKSKVRNVN